MQELPAPVEVQYTIDPKLYRAAGKEVPTEPVSIGLRFTATHAMQSAANNPLLASFNPQFGNRVGNLAQRLHDYQVQMMEFIRLSPENAKRFTEDPLDTLMEVCKLPDNLRDEIVAIQQSWPNPTGGM